MLEGPARTLPEVAFERLYQPLGLVRRLHRETGAIARVYPAWGYLGSRLTRPALEHEMTHPDRGQLVKFMGRAIVLIVASLGLGACSTIVTGGIPPSAFEFHLTVPTGGEQPAGWKIAQVVILLGSASPSGPRAVWCDIEVGLPQVNYLAPVLDEEAQAVCAAAADQAARVVLQQGLEVSALICQRFQAEMAVVIRKSIPGVRVTKIQTPGFNRSDSQRERKWACTDSQRDATSRPSTGNAVGANSMSTSFTAPQLIDLIHRFYPSNIYTTDSRYDSQVEALKLRESRKTAQAESSAWNTLLQRIRQELPGYSLWELPYLLYDPCRCVRVSLADSPMGVSEQKAVVLLVSILAPVHHVYASFQRIESKQVVDQRVWHPPLPPEYRSVEERLDSFAQSVMGTSRLPNETLFAPVPDIQVGNLDLGQAQLIHCLFTDQLW